VLSRLACISYKLRFSAVHSAIHSAEIMGKLVWHEYARLLSITASVYAVWASFWGFFYRKFFWDFIGGTLRDPGGLQPSPNAAVFITLIVKVPAVQILTIALAFFMLAIEYPLPKLKRFAIQRSIVLRVVVLILQASSTLLFYQGTNASLWSLISAGCYIRALVLSEKLEVNREDCGRA